MTCLGSVIPVPDKPSFDWEASTPPSPMVVVDVEVDKPAPVLAAPSSPDPPEYKRKSVNYFTQLR